MNYFYDILLNFNEELYDFYEWDQKDNIEFIKKIPLFRVSSKTLKDNLKYQTKFNKELIELIKNKTIVKKREPLESTFLIADGKNALALELNDDGKVTARSKLMISDEINLIESMFSLKEIELSYEKLKKYPERTEIRQIETIKKIIHLEIETLYKEKKKSKLQYLYYEWFNKREKNMELIVKEMKEELQKDYTETLNLIYDLIKLSYHKV